MQTTGSRLRLQFPPGVLRLLVGATVVFAVLAILAGNSNMITGKAEAGVVSKVTVNSLGNSDDGDCEGAGNDDTVGGDCTLYEAINAANSGFADLINFRPSVFPENNPGTIIIDSEDGGIPPDGVPGNLGCLPSIQRSGITIDATGAGVIIDGDDDDDPQAETNGSPEECVAALYAQANSNGFDFTVIGAGNLTIKQFDADGIQVEGNSLACSAANQGFACSVGTIDISGVRIEQIGEDDQNTDGNDECTGDPGAQAGAAGDSKTLTPFGQILCFLDLSSASDNTDGGGGDGIDIEGVSGANEIHINDNIIDTEYNDFKKIGTCGEGVEGCDGDNAVDIGIDRNLDIEDGIFDKDMLIDISGNSLNADQNTVDIEITGDLGDPFSGDLSAATIQVNDNLKIASDHGDAVDIDWNGCIFKSPLVIEVDGNQNITGNQAGSDEKDAVDINVNGSADDEDCKELSDCGPTVEAGAAGCPELSDGSDFAQVSISVSDNGSIGAPAGDQGVDIGVDLCCGSGHVVVIHVDRNDDIRGGEEGVDINTDICCGDGNSSTITVNDNDEITGQDNAGVDIHNDLGATDANPDGDADDNVGKVEVNGNGRITGAGDADSGVDVENHVGAFFKGSGDNNEADTEVNNNERIIGSGDDGVQISNQAGSGIHFNGGGEADDNNADVSVIGNGQITGADDDGIDVDNTAGSLSFFNTDNQAEGDGNETDLVIQDNDNIQGLDGDGIDAFVFAGGDTKGSTRNVNNVLITENAQIEGLASGGDGIFIEAIVCCTTQKQGNENIIDITLNEKIIGHDGDGIDIEVCCTAAINRTTIADNGRIVGGDEDGIDYVANTGDCVPGDCEDVGLSHDLKQDGFINTVNELIITGNLLEDSEDNGIYICCGAFESDENDVKSLIKDNVIRKNLDHGIEIDTSFGLNIETNEIYLNGDEADTDAGIIIHNQSGIGQGDNNLSDNVWFEVPANHNRISQNSIYDNKGLGIDLAADTDLDGLDDEDHGVGCKPKAEPVNPNDCIAAPDITTLAKVLGQTKLAGRTCSLCLVEVFIADQDPADQGKDPLKQFGEGRTFILGGTADADGNFNIILACALDLPPGTVITTTATDTEKNTSEFSQNLLMPTGTSDCTPTPTNTFTPTATFTPGPTQTPVVVVVTATFTPITPGPTATNTPVVLGKPCGDVNDNGSVNAVDAQLILQYKAGLISSLPNLPSADVNDSGEVTSVDAALVLQAEAGLIPQSALHCPG